MKKIYLSLLSLSFGLAVNAQILTDANHSPASGNMFITYECDSTAINPGASGAGTSWNFASIATRSSVVNNYTVVANTTTSYPIPGVAVEASINNVSYYNSSATDLKYWGGNIFIGGISATLIYTSPAIVAAYPMSLNTNSTAAIAGSISIPALAQNGTFTGISTTAADGTGTLTLPSGTYMNSIRVVTSQTINFTAAFTGTVTQKNYDYYDLVTKNSLFTISTATLVSSLNPTSPSTQTVVTRSIPSTAGVKENKQMLTDLLVFPNPSSTSVSFTTESAEAKQVVIFDVTGKLVEKQNIVEGKLKLNVTSYNNGIYMYNVIGNAGQVLKFGKITVSH